MGDPRKHRKKYQTPLHPWQGDRITEEKEILKEYGLRRKKEIWRISSMLRRFKSQAKRLVAQQTEQARTEEKLLIQKLAKLNLISENAKLDEILGLELKDLLDRRLQAQVCLKGLAKTMKQSRQLIVHGHIRIGDQKVNVPSYLVSMDEENLIGFSPKSNLNDPEHPERAVKKTEEVKTTVKKEKAEENSEKNAKAK